MLVYSNKHFLRIIFEVAGSVLYSTANCLYGLVLAAVNVGVQLLIMADDDISPKLANNYGMSALGMVVALSIVFRTNLGWQRYWEALSRVLAMYSEWQDALVSFMVFANSSIHKALQEGGDAAEMKAKVERVKHLKATVYRHCCLLSALAAHRLSHGDTERMDLQVKVAGWSQQVVRGMALHNMEDLVGADRMPRFKLRSPPGEHWFSSYHDSNAELAKSGWEHEYELFELPTDTEAEALKGSKDRVATVLYWIMFDLAEASHDLDVAPPLQTRMYQEFSSGMVGYVNALEITDVPFPFPYAQLCALLVIVFACFIPIYMACFTQSLIAGPILTFVVFETFWCINEVAKDLENPFGWSLNDIQLDDFHSRFLDFVGEVEIAHEAAISSSPHLSKKQD
jgi:predicted membrane chloride channel (bestrophin family)